METTLGFLDEVKNDNSGYNLYNNESISNSVTEKLCTYS